MSKNKISKTPDACFQPRGPLACRPRSFLVVVAVAGALCAGICCLGAGIAAAVTVSVNPPVTLVQGSDTVTPGKGQGGFDTSTSNFKPYRLPGQAEDPTADPCSKNPDVKSFDPGEPFVISYVNPSLQPVQSSDWWTSLGLQKKSWVVARGEPLFKCNPPKPTEDPLARTSVFYSEPFQFQFLDFNPKLFGSFPPEAGLALWNLNTMTVLNNAKNGTKFNPNLDNVGWGNAAPAHQARVTVGLAGVHPLRVDQFPTTYPTAPPWTNIKVASYSDWGVVASYTDKTGANQMRITMANGSPFVWFEKAKGNQPFNVWVGGTPGGSSVGGTFQEVSNSGTVVVVNVTTFYNPFGSPTTKSTAMYAIYADSGTWKLTKEAGGTLGLYTNAAAKAVVVTALPHNVNVGNLAMAWKTIQPYACRKTTDTKLFLPVPKTTVTINGKSVTLGYDAAAGTVIGQLQVTTQPLTAFPGCIAGPALQLLFPHHREALIAAQQNQVISAAAMIPPAWASGSFAAAADALPKPALVWNTLLGPAWGFSGSTMAMQNLTKGVLPILPSVAIDSATITNPSKPTQTAAEDIYDTLKTWFFVEEPTAPGIDPITKLPLPLHLNSFSRNAGTYLGAADNSYINKTSTLRELVVVADQLAQSKNTKLNVIDPQLGKTKRAAAAEMRTVILETLEEMIGQWADIYSAQLFQYNPAFKTYYGYPDGYGAVGSLSDHHYHYGYFLRAAATIARYDRAWLNKHLDLFVGLQGDVANFNRADKKFPFLRNFNPYYGHSWADGAAYNSNNQESTSEAINFEVGLIELGELLNRPSWRDFGLYMYEQEILASEQYFFNADAKLDDIAPKTGTPCPTSAPFFEVQSDPPICYNGNWPRNFVTYTRATDNTTQRHTLITRVFNEQLSRTTFFDDSPIAAYTIEAVPAGPSMVYVARNANWLKTTWAQLISDDNFYQLQNNPGNPQPSVYQNVLAAIQTLMPTSGSGIDGTGRNAALIRINKVHPYYPAAMNTTGKYLAYTLGALGQIDSAWVPNAPNGVVFKSGGSSALVAYNPTGAPIDVTFTNSSTKAKLGPVKVPAGVEQTLFVSGGAQSTFRRTVFQPPRGLLYLHADGSMDPTPGPLVPPSISGTSFPTDNNGVASSLIVVPTRRKIFPKQGSFPPPPPDEIVTFSGYFSGTLTGAPMSTCKKLSTTGPLVCDPTKTLQAVSRFGLYTDQCLYPGWQNCTPKDSDGNIVSMRVSYYFNAAVCDPIAGTGKPCNADRVEFYGGLPPNTTNTFGLENKFTEYYLAGVNLGNPGPEEPKTSGFDGTFGLNIPGLPSGGCGGKLSDGSPTKWDPATQQPPGPCGFFKDPMTMDPIPPAGLFWKDVVKGVVTIELWGGPPATQCQGEPPNQVCKIVGKLAPVPVSVNVSRITSRASWFKPPYD